MVERGLLENQIGVVGEEDVVSGFKALGFNTYIIEDYKSAGPVLDEVVQKGLAVCLVEESIYSFSLERINNYKNLTTPIFIPFSKIGKNQLLDNIVKNIRLRATGTF